MAEGNSFLIKLLNYSENLWKTYFLIRRKLMSTGVNFPFSHRICRAHGELSEKGKILCSRKAFIPKSTNSCSPLRLFTQERRGDEENYWFFQCYTFSHYDVISIFPMEIIPRKPEEPASAVEARESIKRRKWNSRFMRPRLNEKNDNFR